MTIFALTFLALFSVAEREFFDTAVAQQKEGYAWLPAEIDCVEPDYENAKQIVMTTPTGKELVCFKLKK